MRSNAQALARYDVTCNCIAPQANTRMTDRGRMVDKDAEPPSARAAGTRTDPAAIAPLAVWLGSDDAAKVTGRIFGAEGHRISVYNEPVQERVLLSKNPAFDIDWLFENWDRTIGSDRFYPKPTRLGGAPQPQPASR
jgi:hypothetical protein